MKNERFMLDDTGELIDIENAQFIDYGEEVCKLLNDLSEKNKQLKKENQELFEYGKELLEYINTPPKHKKSIFKAVTYFKKKELQE